MFDRLINVNNLSIERKFTLAFTASCSSVPSASVDAGQDLDLFRPIVFSGRVRIEVGIRSFWNLAVSFFKDSFHSTVYRFRLQRSR